MYFLNKVDIYPKHFISTGEKLFALRKGLTMHKKCTKSAQKSAQKVLLLYRYLCL